MQTNLKTLLQEGIQCYQQGQLAAAEERARAVLAQDDGQPDALQLLGLIAFDAGYTEQALTLIQGAITNQPDRPAFYVNLGNCLFKTGKLEQALASFEAALERQPDFGEALNMAGILYQELHQPQKALEVLQRALKQNPGSVEIRYNLAVALQKQQQFSESQRLLSQVLQAAPGHLDALNLRGILRQETGQFEKAESDFKAVISRDPKHPEAHFNLGTLKILLAQLPEGWDEYEWRWDSPSKTQASFGLKRWQGQTLQPTERLLAFADAGFGDSLQFMRYLLAEDLPQQQLVFRCQTPLVSLFQAQGWEISFVSEQAPLPEGLNYEIPLLSFPALRRTTTDNIPWPGAYLKAPASGPKLPAAASTARKRVGIVWAGSPDNAINLKRSCNLERFLKLAEAFPDIAWISLQKGPATADLTPFADGQPIWNMDAQLQSFGDTAHVISQLDLVISVDTSVVHLAAALGCPTWVLLPMVPDWRWFLERTDSPWYQSVRLFRQPERNGWKQVFRQVQKALEQENVYNA